MSVMWKDFLYFQKKDKIAIILLSILIVFCGIFAIMADSLFENKEAVQAQHELLAEFDKFQRGMTENEMLQTDEQETTVLPQNKKTKSNSSKKLIEGESIELNGASISTLKRIPGVGEEYAKRIYEYHNRIGGFVHTDQLKEIQGITDKRHKNILPYVTIKRKPKQIRINKITADELAKHSYISENQAIALINFRKEKGRLTNANELLQCPTFSPRDVDKLSGYISFD